MGNQNGRPAGKAPDPEVLDKEQQVLMLRRQGHTWDAISQRVGYSSPSSSRDAFLRASNRIIRDDLNEVRQMEIDRLDIALSAIWHQIEAGDLLAINTMLKIMDRRSKMLALDAPRRLHVQEVVPEVSVEELERKIQQIIDEGGFEAFAS
jgi:hypothetical protein